MKVQNGNFDKIVDLPNWIGSPILPRMAGLHSASNNPALRLRCFLHPRTSSGSIPRDQAERRHGPMKVPEMAWVGQ